MQVFSVEQNRFPPSGLLQFYKESAILILDNISDPVGGTIKKRDRDFCLVKESFQAVDDGTRYLR